MEKKKVLLIGDSIRMGYDKYVKNYLADSCEVYYPKDNCRFAQYTLRHLSDWKICEMLDIEYREFTLADYESVKEVIGL